ncbi:MAG: hypothetical protein MI974_16915 [Chitinophagales bacterium]|nr:hypothetical protein [Chitinophagales bacterium]
MWKRLSFTLSKTINAWIPAWSLTFLLSIFQTISGRLNGIELQVWGLLSLLFFPGFLVAFYAFMRSRNVIKIIPPQVHRTIIVSTLVYGIVVLASLLLEGWATAGEISIIEYRKKSMLWLLPLEIILLIAYSLIFIGDPKLLIPDENRLVQLANEEAVNWLERKNEVKEKCFRQIAEGELSEAFSTLEEHYKQFDIGNLNQLTLLQSQYAENKKNMHLNLVHPDELQRQQNKITLALMNLIQ